MNKSERFVSIMAKMFELYVDDYMARGTMETNIVSALKSFDQYLYRTGYEKDYITEAAFAGWSETLVNLTWRTKYTTRLKIVQFCKYLSMMGYPSYIPPRQLYAKCNSQPYIFTESEIESLFSYVDNWKSRTYPRNCVSFILPCLFRLLYSTGMRIGEALQIQNKDIDLDKRLIILRHTKNGRERIAPINDSLHKVLSQYLLHRNKMPFPWINEKDSALFVNLAGNPCTVKALDNRFREIIDEIGLPAHPRIHDLRHTACVQSLRKQLAAGEDIYNILPKLSAFMGHVCVASTEYYVRLTKEAYPEINVADEKQKREINEIIERAIFYEEE